MRFATTWCSQCGIDLGPGDSGVSSCSGHPGVVSVPAARFGDEEYPDPEESAVDRAYNDWVERRAG